MMATRDSSHIMLLKEEVRSLSEELVQCQADKEFVWSLWKRLQVANPDLTQAVSLVVEREKWKAEAKDRKVLEILQAKDYKIQELDQRVTGQQQEITNLVQRKMAVDEDRGLVKKELEALRRKLGNKSQELKDVKEERGRREEALEEEKEALESCCSALRGDLEQAQRQERRHGEEKEALESCCSALRGDLEQAQRQERRHGEEKEALESCCSGLRGDLEQAQRQERRHGEERDSADAKVKEMEGDLSDAQRQVADLQGQCSSLTDLLSSRQKEVAQRDQHVTQLGRELQEVQALYRQSSEHAAEQAQLIQQLEGLNLDTQRVLRNQEEAHTADTTSYQKLYNELSICYQALKSNEGQLRQSHVALTTQLGQKEQQIVQLQGQLQQQQQQQTHNQQQLPQTMAPAGPPARQTNSKHFEEQTLYDSPDQELSGEEAPPSTCSPVPQEPPGPPDTSLALSPSRGQHTGRRQSAPVQLSRSLSPASSVESGRGVEKRIHDLEELLRLKTDENEELRRAHEKRHERLRLVQTNYRTVKDQLREVEDAQGRPRGRAQQRAEPWQLRQENSDAVWNELAYFKHLNKKLTTHKTNLEEELDVLRVQAAMDRATVQELRLCLQNEQQELLHKVAADPEVKNSTPRKPSAERVEQSLKKIEQLERRTVSMEQETEMLREDNQHLQEANTALTQDKEHLQGSLARLRTQGAARDEAAHAQALAQGERHRTEALALETQLEGARREAGRTRQQLLRLRQELGILRAARDFNRRQRGPKANMLTGLAAAATAGGGISGGALANNKVKFKTGMRPRGPAWLHRHRAVGPNQAIGGGGRSPARDDWEDISADSGEEYSDSLDSHPIKKLTSDLAGVEQQKKVLEMELEQWRQIHRTNTPQQLPSTAPQPLETPSPPVLKALEAEVKHLHTKLKSSKAEVTSHTSANKALRAQLLEREEKLRELQGKVIHTERDVHMKRQLVEDVKTRMKFLLETEKTHRGLVEELEKKVKTMTEEATNRKAFIDSLKRRLSVATKEKSQYETTCQDLKEGLDKKEQCVEALQARVRASERAQAELEQTASRQMEGLAQQSTVALEALHRRLGLAHTQLEQLQAFTKALASETLREVQDAKSQLRKNKKMAEKKKAVGAGGLSKQSMVKAQSIAASILNMTEMDLAEMLDTDEEEDDVAADSRRDQEWLDQVMKILQQQIPSAALLMEVLCVKMKERKVLTEALAALTTPVSEIA
ncbi:centlein isoform X4 [Oncorhynchus nerka]|uniref:centlein isoform X4 n=1 Tax=Oncorhynchus nerka TaxID=8023 RepID=UPI0031B899AF